MLGRDSGARSIVLALLFQGNLALFLRANGQKTEAEPLLVKVLDGRRKMFGVKHPDTIISINNCAAIARDAVPDLGAE